MATPSSAASTELTLFKPFEADKNTKLAYKGEVSEPKPKRIEITDVQGPAAKVIFRKWYRNPTPAPRTATTGDSTAATSSSSARPPPKPLLRSLSSSRDSRESTPKVTVVRPPPPPRQPVPRSEVLSRIGRLERNQNVDGDLKKYWMPDKACKECSECQAKFNLIVRRHHCRICGRIFCNTCCSLTIPGVLLRPDLQGNLRVCKECRDIFHEFHSSKLKSESGSGSGSKQSESQGLEVGPSPKSQLEPLQPPESPVARTSSSGNFSRTSRPVNVLKSWDDTSSGRSQEVELSPSRTNVEFDNPAPLRSNSSKRRQSSFDSLRSLATERDETLLALDEDEVEYIVRDVWQHLLHPVIGLPPQTHRYRLRHFPNTLTAHDIVEWMLKNGFARSREVAIRVGQALVETKRLNIVSSLDTIFKDESNLLLELGEAATIEPDSVPTPLVTDAPKWFQHLPEDGDSELEASTCLLNTDGSTMRVRYSHPPSSFTSDSASTFLESRNFDTTVVVTSVSELTGGKDAGTTEDEPRSGIASQSQEDYLVVNPESLNRADNSTPTPSAPQGKDSAPQQAKDEASPGLTVPKPIPDLLSSFTNSPAFKSNRLLSYAMIDNQELLKALPVTGLSLAAAAARDIDAATEGTDRGDSPSQQQTRVKSNAEARSLFEMSHDHHFDSLMIQLIKSFGLSLSWLGVVKPLVVEVSRKVKTNLFRDDVMDLNHYVKVKKIPGGRRKDGTLYYGVVCTKNVTHKKMNHSIRNPTVLLLKCAFEFQRRENQFSSFDTLQLQEEKYLKNLVARVKNFKPSIILVQKSVSRLALEMLYELGIVVAVNVKPSVMARVARSTQGDLLHSLDQLFFQQDVRLGSCGHFYIRNFILPDGMKKTLMYFDSCDPKFGCAITLQGGTKRELKRVKRVASFGLLVAHNSRLETAFLVDEFAWPDSLTPTLLPDVEDYSSPPSTPEWPLFPSLLYPVEGISPAELAAKLAKIVPEALAGGDRGNPCDGSAEQRDRSNQSEPINSQENEGNEDRFSKDGAELNGQHTPVVTVTGLGQSSTGESRVESRTGSVSGSASKLQLVPKTVVSSGNVPADLGEREFCLALENQIVSISPNVQFSAPYLQTALGMRAEVRHYLPKAIYWSYQFRAKSPPRAQRDEEEGKYLSLRYRSAGPLEMGITGASSSSLLVGGATEAERRGGVAHTAGAANPPYHFTHSYKSVSDHPLTQAIFLQMANTNEMKAALADYRARAGLPDEPDCFFFPSARRAGDYQFHLEGIFKKYGKFETEEEEEEEAVPGSVPSKWDEIETRAASEAEKRKPVRRRVQRRKIPEKKKEEPSAFGHSSHGSSSSECLRKPSESSHESQPEISKSVAMVSLDVQRGIARISKDEPEAIPSAKDAKESTESGEHGAQEITDDNQVVSKESTESGEHSAQEITDDSQVVSKGNKTASVGSKLSEKFGTLEDLDHGSATRASADEEENLDLDLTSEEWSFLGSGGQGLTSFQVVDCMDPFNHQGISILFSSTCHDGQKHQTPCVPPVIIPMAYYGRNDISLGEFLYRYCFRHCYHCQSCGVDMTKHQRHILYGDSALSISMQELDTSLPGGDDVIFTWLACRHCSQCTPYIQMSADSLLFSFAKFLELKFNTSSYKTRYYTCSNGNSGCKHSLHGSYIQYFCQCKMIAAFEPSNISILEVCVPPRVISITTPHSEYHHNYSTEIRHLQRITEGVFYRIRQRLQQYNMEPVGMQVKEHIASSKAERNAFRDKVRWLKDLLVNGGFFPSAVSNQLMSEEERDDKFFTLQDGIADFKRSLTEVVDCWNIHLEGLDSTVKIHRSRKLEQTEGYYSPRDSPQNVAMEIDSATTSPNAITPRDTPLSTPLGSPPAMATTTPSPDWSLSSHQNSSTSSKSHSMSNSMLGHSRNLSDSGVHEKLEKPHPDKWPGHKRQLSDSFAASRTPSGAVSEAGCSDSPTAGSRRTEQMKEEERPGDESRSESRSSLDGTGSESDSRGVQNQEKGSGSNSSRNSPLALGRNSPLAPLFPGVGFPIPEETLDPTGDMKTVEKTEYQRVKAIFGPSKGDLSTPKQAAPQGEDGSHTDSAVGIFAKLRGKDTEQREDPTKFYLVDPAEITNSPIIGIHSQTTTLEPPAPRPYRRPGTIPRKTAANTAVSQTEAFGDARSAEKRLARERNVLVRPFQKLPHPFELNEHHNMHMSLKIPVAIYEKEPTSLIAYALSSREYAQELNKVIERRQAVVTAVGELKGPPSPKALKRLPSEPEKPQASSSSKGSTFKAALQEFRKKGSTISVFSGLSSSTADQLDPFDKFDEDSRKREGSFLSSGKSSLMGDVSDVNPESSEALEGTKWNVGPELANTATGSRSHISLEFTDRTASFFCKVYFAEEFHRLREQIFPSGEDRFIRSLARCVKYDAKGGKTKSTFCKVVDDRFILKQIKSVEISFFEQFAPHYFEHVNRALEEKRPLVLAKILGVYSIGYRNTKTGNSKRLDVIIMENLLYGHNYKSSKVFDLKGSMRSRYINPSKDNSSDVLLDENYLNYICYDPVYVYHHSKCVLMQAIQADTEFLARNSIMDYSLLTCIDPESGELAVGIIDYVRAFTLDKRLEMHLKKAAGRVLPTVVYPELYRKRFCEAMERYFTVVPDKWTGLGHY